MLETEFQYFLDHQDELVKKYKGKYIVIKGNKVIDYWDTFTDAYFNTQEQGHELGTFLIQECLPGEECYTTNMRVRGNIIEYGSKTGGGLLVNIERAKKIREKWCGGIGRRNVAEDVKSIMQGDYTSDSNGTLNRLAVSSNPCHHFF